ncbi:MAG: hypothetical protein HGA45_20340, partial [Chloroflexales bacterium]|nr:hypothetical protein [Chloroflexales bacterium]
MENFAQLTPRAFGALEPFPALRAAVETSLRRQTARATAALARFQERPRLLGALEQALRDPYGGLIVLEGPPGSGVTSLLASLAARHPLPLWLAPEAGASGPAALYAQIVALYRPAVPLLDPTATTDPTALDRLIAEAVAGRVADTPIALLIDDLDSPGQPPRPGPTPLPADLPRGATLLLGCAPGTPTPYTPTLRLRLPNDDPDLASTQAHALADLGCGPRHAWAGPIVAGSQGNFLYLRLALAMLREGMVDAAALPQGLDALLRVWWQSLGRGEQRLAALIAAACEPLPLALVTDLAGADPGPTLARWEQLGLIDLTVQALTVAPDAQPEGALAAPTLLGAFAHGAPVALIARVAAPALAAAHGDLAALALQRAEEEATARRQPGQLNGPLGNEELYLRRQLARHAALALPELRKSILPRVISRDWVRAHERRGGLLLALDDARWELRTAADPGLRHDGDGAELRLVRAVALAGILATRSRSLTPDAAAEALTAGLERGGREPSLKRVLDIVDRLPDGPDKAEVLRRLGEVCYGTRMRSSAMRLLSRALDLEAGPVSRAWRDTREGLHAALAGAALELGAVDTALAIAERIEHLERRAMVETQAVRYMLAAGERARAQRLARAIFHESMGAWARAEVGVELVRAGDPRGAMLLEEIVLETVAAWAQIELACGEAASDEAAALRRIEALPNQGQRDRGLARLSRALAGAGNDGAALAAAERIAAVEVRVAALIDLRLTLEGLVAMLALERATRDIGAIEGDDRAPLVSALAAALAALGRSDRALDLAGGLPAGEERDRALARVAVALAQRGELEPAQDVLDQVTDDDEQAWAYDEFARLLAAAGRWGDATSMCERIGASDQRAQAAADLAIERAKRDDPVAALAMAMAIDMPAERARALTLVAPRLVAA